METEERFPKSVGPHGQAKCVYPLALPVIPAHAGFSLLLIDGGVGDAEAGPGGAGPISIGPKISDAANSPPGRRRLYSLFLFLPLVLMARRTQPSICS